MVLAYILIFLSAARGYANVPIPEKLVNLTYGNNSYLINHKVGNSGILLITNLDANKLIGSGAGSENQGWQGIAVAISVAIIGAIAASWNFFQARWNGRYFQKLILEELGEIGQDGYSCRGSTIEIVYEKGFHS
jgi:hypothetical protein